MHSHPLPVLPPPGYSSGTRWCLDVVVVGNIFPPQISACSRVMVPLAWLGGRRLQVCRANLRRRAPYTQERDSDQGSRRGLALCKHTINWASICSCTAEAHHLPTPRHWLRVGRFCGTPHTGVSPTSRRKRLLPSIMPDHSPLPAPPTRRLRGGGSLEHPMARVALRPGRAAGPIDFRLSFVGRGLRAQETVKTARLPNRPTWGPASQRPGWGRLHMLGRPARE